MKILDYLRALTQRVRKLAYKLRYVLLAIARSVRSACLLVLAEIDEYHSKEVRLCLMDLDEEEVSDVASEVAWASVSGVVPLPGHM